MWSSFCFALTAGRREATEGRKEGGAVDAAALGRVRAGVRAWKTDK